LRARLPRLGADFAKLWTANAVSNHGDGVTMVAGPLLVASITTDPAAVAAAAFAQQLPWLLFALISGAWADRLACTPWCRGSWSSPFGSEWCRGRGWAG
jgi:hypothetical protein